MKLKPVNLKIINFVAGFKGNNFEHFIPYDDKFDRHTAVRDFISPEHYKPPLMLEK